MKINMIWISHEEFVKGSYEYVGLNLYNGEKLIFDSGDVVKDFQDAVNKARSIGRDTVYSSSCDDFLMDEDDYYYDKHNLIKRRRKKK